MSIFNVTDCPSCKTEQQQIEWYTWCSKCGMIVCSHCVHDTNTCLDRYNFNVPRRGKRYRSPRKIDQAV